MAAAAALGFNVLPKAAKLIFPWLVCAPSTYSFHLTVCSPTSKAQERQCEAKSVPSSCNISGQAPTQVPMAPAAGLRPTINSAASGFQVVTWFPRTKK